MAVSMCAARAAAVVVIAGLAAGCASPRLDAQWSDPEFAAGSLRGARVLVACEANDTIVKRVCQDQLAAEVVARGATAVVTPDVTNPNPGRLLPDHQYIAIARANRAQAVLAATVSAAGSTVSPGLSIGIGGFSIGSGGSGVGVGVSAPIGGGRMSIGYAATSRLTDAASGRLMWTARATAPPSSDLNTQLGELARTVLGAAERAGMF